MWAKRRSEAPDWPPDEVELPLPPEEVVVVPEEQEIRLNAITVARTQERAFLNIFWNVDKKNFLKNI